VPTLAAMLAFGPDGYLYISVGDGGAGNDVGDGHGATGNGQNINTVHGSILRIDPLDPMITADSLDAVSANGQYRIPVDNPFVGVDGVDEIYAYGFRNPWRFKKRSKLHKYCGVRLERTSSGKDKKGRPKPARLKLPWAVNKRLKNAVIGAATSAIGHRDNVFKD